MKGQGGVTLVEMLVVLALAAILATLAMPGMADMLRTYRLNAAVSDLHGAIDLTRSQAVARGRRVLLVPLEPGGVEWRKGWMVLVDEDNDRRPGPGEEVIASHGPLDERTVITARFTSNRTPQYVAYCPSGRSCNDTGSAARWGTISFHEDGKIRRIKINMLGRARICRPDTEPGTCEGDEGGV